MLFLLKQASRPSTAVLGVLPGTDVFVSLKRYPAALELPGVKGALHNSLLAFLLAFLLASLLTSLLASLLTSLLASLLASLLTSRRRSLPVRWRPDLRQQGLFRRKAAEDAQAGRVRR